MVDDTQSYNLAAKNGITERKIIKQLLLQIQVTNITAKSLSHMPLIWWGGVWGQEEEKNKYFTFSWMN
jgi:hypothetical protein